MASSTNPHVGKTQQLSKREIIQQFLKCNDSGVMCKIVDRTTKDEDGEFVWVYANVYRNSRCPNGHSQECDTACGHAEAKLVKDLCDKTMDEIIRAHAQREVPLMTIQMTGTPCRVCSELILEFYKYYGREVLIKVQQLKSRNRTLHKQTAT